MRTAEYVTRTLGGVRGALRQFLAEPSTRLAPVIYWNDFKKVKPSADEEYLVCDYDKIIKISYFDGEKWGYYHNSDDDILFWSLLPSVPL